MQWNFIELIKILGGVMADPIRVKPEEVYKKLQQGKILLVCAYDDEAKYKRLQLKGSISMSEFKTKLPALSMDQEIIFYCAWPQEASAAGQAVKYLDMGYKNAKVLGGGVEGWKKAGYKVLWHQLGAR